MDVRQHNRAAWDRQVAHGNSWTIPVEPEVVERALRGEWSVVLTNQRPVPRDWFPADLRGVELLGLASGGGQQGPVLAAAGARVTILDNSPAQLAQDERVAKRHGLALRTVLGTMDDLSMFEDASFDLVFNPVSTCFAPEVRSVWREVARVLRPGGALLAGFVQPATYVFDPHVEDTEGRLEVRHALPYADARALSDEQLRGKYERGEPLEFSHTLTDLIGGQLDAGLHLVGFYEDLFGDDRPMDKHLPALFATRAMKPA